MLPQALIEEICIMDNYWQPCFWAVVLRFRMARGCDNVAPMCVQQSTIKLLLAGNSGVYLVL